MLDLFNAQPRPDPQQLAAIKGWVCTTLGLADDTTVLVTELRCHEAGCPPLETVIAIMRPGAPPEQRTLHKAIADVSLDDIRGLYAARP